MYLRPLLASSLVFLLPALFVRGEIGWPEVFDPLRVATIYIEIDPGDWNAVLHDTDFYDVNSDIRKTCKLWGDGPDTPNSIETALTVQIRRKSDPALPDEGNPQKVSLKIDINEFVPGQQWRGLKKLSLENGAGGNGVLKEGFAMNMHRLAGEAGYYPQPCGYAAWVRLVVNGQYAGLYSSPEQRDATFFKNRGIYRQGASWLYEVNGGLFRDETVSSADSPTHTHLNYYPFRAPNSPPANFESDVQQWVDMRSMLTMASIEAFIANTDGLFTKSASNQGKNSFCADLLPSTFWRRMYLPWDLDGGFANSTWDIFAGGSGQQSQRRYQSLILQHPWFKEYYKHVFTELLDGPLSAASQNAFLDQLEPVLQPLLVEDPNADDGQFDSLRSYIAARIANIRAQIGGIVQPPVFSLDGGEIVAGQTITLTHSNPGGTNTIYYTADGSDPRSAVIPATLAGSISPTANAYSGAITITNPTRIAARVRNVNGALVNWSSLREAQFNMAGDLSTLRCTEIMYHPKGDAAFEDEDEFEFIEFKNTGPNPLNLSGCKLNGVEFAFPPGSIVPAGGFVVLVANPVAFSARYPAVPFAGVYLRNLANSREKLRLTTAEGSTILSFEYDNSPAWPQGADGFGYSLVPANTFEASGDPANWRASSSINGSPGQDDPAPAFGVGIVINEVLTRSNTPLEDAIELHNPAGAAIDISGWYLSDDLDPLDPTRTSLKKYRIPAGTIVAAGGYKTFYEADFSPALANENALVPFALSRDGDQLYLSAADSAGNLTGQIVGAKFGAADDGLPFGRISTSVGGDFTALSVQSFGTSNPASKVEFRAGSGAVNAAPRVGPVVISEVMYQPREGGSEFVELQNISGTAVDLSGWTLEGAALTLPSGTTISAGGLLLIVDTAATSVTQFITDHSVPASVPVLGALFDLGDGGESLELKKPNTDAARPHIVVDRVSYNDKAPWPTEAAGHGPSLERHEVDAYGNEPRNWRTIAIGGTPGRTGSFDQGITAIRGTSWKFRTGRNLGSAWRAPGYSDAAWQSGKGPLGFGSPGVATLLLNTGVTAYFRKEVAFNDDPAAIASLVLKANYSDGFVAYLNGQEVARRSLPDGAISDTTFASSHPAGTFETIDLTAHRGKLVRGKNVLGVEVHLSSPTDADLLWDSELTYSVPASNPDQDGDGLPDTWEDLFRLNKLDPTDALLDLDGDGCSNFSEYRAGTDPRDPADRFGIDAVLRDAQGRFVVTFTSRPNRSYTVLFRDDLTTGTWQKLVDVPLTEAGGEVSIPDASSAGVSTRFYRLATPAQQ